MLLAANLTATSNSVFEQTSRARGFSRNVHVIFMGGNISKPEAMNIDTKETILSHSELILRRI